MTADGESVEVAVIGREGIIAGPPLSAPASAPHTAVVALSGDALRLRAEHLKQELERDAALQRAMIEYSYSLIADIAQGSVCNCFHTARQRLARWLLAASD